MYKVLGVLHRALGVLHRALGVLHRVRGVLGSDLPLCGLYAPPRVRLLLWDLCGVGGGRGSGDDAVGGAAPRPPQGLAAQATGTVCAGRRSPALGRGRPGALAALRRPGALRRALGPRRLRVPRGADRRGRWKSRFG